MKSAQLILFFAFYSAETFASGNEDSFVITTEPNNGKEKGPKGEENFGDVMVPKIYEMQIESNVSNRFAYTLVTSKLRNFNKVAREATFSVILPDQAFISEFVMVIRGQSYKAYVKEKEEAKKIYDKAVARGSGAAHVALTFGEYSQFTVSVNVEALGKATFLLKYEELLRLKDHQYELVINIQPNQPVNDLYVNVMINESRPLKFIRTPPLRSGNEISKRKSDLDPRASIFRFDSKSALVQFKPNIEKQKEFARHLGTDTSKGLSGQFVVQYDVERDSQGGEVLVKDGYFVHFFAPSEVKPLNKFVVFVLDTGRNVTGQRIDQLKLAMTTILDELDDNDCFHVLNFQTTYTTIWNLCARTPTHFRSYTRQMCLGTTPLHFRPLESAFPGSSDNIEAAKGMILNLRSGGRTNSYGALKTALNLVKLEKARRIYPYLPPPIIIFLTNAESTGINSSEQIITDITNRNDQQTPIYSLSFGDNADKNFLEKLSQKNYGFSRHIYESLDAALQVKNFYKEIASPLLSGVKFEYVPDATSLTKTKFPLHFGGSELVVAGKLLTSTFPELPRILGNDRIGPVTLNPTIERPITSLERLWAYLTVQQLLDKKEASQKKKALDLALKYSFVTPVSSLIIAKPNSADSNIDPKRIISFSVSRTKNIIRSVTQNVSKWRYVPMAGSVCSYFAPDRPRSGARHYYFGLDDKSRSMLDDLLSSLPWLEDRLNENRTLKSLPDFELGLNRKFLKKPICPKTPLDTPGHCELLHKCLDMSSFLHAEEIFISYFCPLRRGRRQFVGVCCPDPEKNEEEEEEYLYY